MKLLKSKLLFVVMFALASSPLYVDARQDQTNVEKFIEKISGTTLEGKVTSETGPVIGARVFVFESELLATAVTNDDGTFEAELKSPGMIGKVLGALTGEQVRLLVVAEGKIAQLRSVSINNQEDIHFQLQDQSEPLKGRITSQGLGVANAKLRFEGQIDDNTPVATPNDIAEESQDTPRVQETVTDSDGSFQLQVEDRAESLQGRIIDNQGLGVSEAKLRIENLIDENAMVVIPNEITKKLQDTPGLLEVVTDSEGAFQFRGIPKSLLGSISVTGKGLVPATLTQGNFDNEIVLIAQPGITLRGKVLDARDRTEIPNVVVSILGAARQTTSDDSGSFELMGLPAFQALQLSTEAAGEQAYVPQVKVLPIEQGFDQLEIELMLQPATWANCEVVDFSTNSPAKAELFYFPTPANDHFQQFVNLLTSRGAAPSVATDAAGKARIAVVPGPGIIVTSAPGFPANESVNKLTDEQQAMVLGILRGRAMTSVKSIDVKDLEADVQIRSLVSKGRAIAIKVSSDLLGAEEKLVVHRAASKTTFMQPITGTSFSAEQFQSGETRQILIHATGKRLGAIAEIEAMADSPVEVALQPTGSLAGQIVDEEGEPAVGLAIQFEIMTEDGPQQVAPSVFTDANGRFSNSSLIASLNYKLSAIRFTKQRRSMMTADSPKMDSQWTMFDELKINSGEHVDLGRMVLFSKESIIPTRTQQPEEQPNVQADCLLPSRFAGSVAQVTGERLGGATISLTTWPDRTGDIVHDVDLKPIVLAQSVADSRGNFQLDIEPRLEENLLASTANNRENNVAIVVVAEKMGAVQLPLQQIVDPQNLTIEMGREMIVRGRVTFGDNQPEIRLLPSSTMKVYAPDSVGQIVNNLKAGMDLEQASEAFQPLSTLDPIVGGIESVWQTTADGVFLVRNLPLNAIFELHAVSGSGVEQSVTVLSRPIRGFEYKSSNESKDPARLSGSRIRLNLRRDGE